ncbi:ABC transporter ATP-binding protein [Sporomusa sp. KB1]|jgi:peptide/nickel transport system ATP-binding protein|uniref:ABC transporter ATP-binding protein n=1 Tax=Sporomusa sp. KB1 TaxID=943346 RepID=UPI0011A475B8|nr:ABC transporter ATP-binding protein [Sporomusa sp. KB1]TWH49169.1 peptide/nickel transport system ATP-binding protein [Sporomusa sp. KB1]
MLLEVSELFVSYAEHEIVRNVNLSLDEGEVLAIVGESGSGKTTVVRAILGCLPHEGRVNGGRILFEGKNLLENTPEEWCRLCGTKVAMVFQESGSMLDPIQCIGQQFVEYICEHSPMTKREAAEAAKGMLRKMHLPNPENIMKSYPFELSGGMRQRVGVALAMFFRPRLLLADEPTSALDVTTQAQVVKEMMEICRQDKTAIILVTHNIGVAAYMSDMLLVMREGQIVEAGRTDDVIAQAKSAYTKELLDAVPQVGGKRYVG